MKNRDLMVCLASSLAAVPTFAAAPKQNVDKPNIVWFMIEDIAPQFLAMFNNGKGCHLPTVEKMAQEGMIYPNCYSNAPVSSAARTTLITGCFAPSFEGAFHRHIEQNPMPEGLKMFPAYLREAGYYTYCSTKMDYNVEMSDDVWDDGASAEDEWSRRPDKSRPFFLQKTTMTTHESRLLFTEDVYKSVKTRHSLDSVYLLPHVPDTHLMRYTYATNYDRLEDADGEFAKLVERLKSEGEFENTIIFFFGDNGGTTPGTKGYTDNVGVQVPLMVYVPEKWREKVGAEAGVVRQDLISFIDFGRTALAIADAPTPKRLDGTPFLGKKAKRGVESVVCYGDRFDELYSFNRSIRKGEFRYERNYQPYQRQSLFALYRYKQMAFREWKELYQAGKLNKAQSAFHEPQGVEELYDLKTDPFELNNLASDPKYKSKLKELRKDLNSYLLDKCDLGFFPENIIHEEAMANPDTYGQNNKSRIKGFMKIADLQQLPYAKAKEGIVKALNSSDDVNVWWGITTAVAFKDEAKELISNIKPLLKHQRSFVRSKAMLFLSMCGEKITVKEMKSVFPDCRKDSETLLVLNDYAIMVEEGYVAPFPISVKDAPAKDFSIEWRIRYLQSLYDGTPLSVICDNKFGK